MERYETLPEAWVEFFKFWTNADPFAICKVYPKSKRKAQGSNSEATGSNQQQILQKSFHTFPEQASKKHCHHPDDSELQWTLGIRHRNCRKRKSCCKLQWQLDGHESCKKDSLVKWCQNHIVLAHVLWITTCRSAFCRCKPVSCVPGRILQWFLVRYRKRGAKRQSSGKNQLFPTQWDLECFTTTMFHCFSGSDLQ